MNAETTHAQHLLDHLAPAQIAAVVHLMEVMLDPLSRKLANARPEDETISADEERAVFQLRKIGSWDEEMMLRAFSYYSENRRAIHARTDVSAHSKAAPMGVIRLLKWLS